MQQTAHFFNLGYGWLCKHCSAEDTERKHHHGERRSQPLALAKWVDEDERRGMVCTRCGIFEQGRLPGKKATDSSGMKN
jgi:hypothetical protein